MTDDKKIEPADKPEELSDEQAEEVSGGPIYMPPDGVPGRFVSEPKPRP